MSEPDNLREAVARIVDPWSFNQCEWASQQDNDEVLRAYLPKREAALAKADAILALPVLSREGWRPIETAPKDGTYVLALIGGADGHWAHLNGRAFVIRHEGKTPSGFDLGWALFPGFGGVGDHWLAGWMPLPTLSAIPSWGSSRPWPIDGTGNLGSAVASGDAGDATTEGGGA